MSKPKTEIIEPSKKRKARPMVTRGKPKFEMANEALMDIYDKTINVLNQAIKCGTTDLPLGLMALLLYADLLHGGAYTVPIQQRPFFMKKSGNSPYYQGEIHNTDASQGLLGWVLAVFGVTNPGPFVQEIMVDANVPHVFPKLLSDEAYAEFKTLLAHIATTDVFQNSASAVKTFVEAAATAETATAQAVKTMMPSPEQLKGLTALMSLIGV